MPSGTYFAQKSDVLNIRMRLTLLAEVDQAIGALGGAGNDP